MFVGLAAEINKIVKTVKPSTQFIW